MNEQCEESPREEEPKRTAENQDSEATQDTTSPVEENVESEPDNADGDVSHDRMAEALPVNNSQERDEDVNRLGKVKPGNKISFRLEDEGEEYTAKVLSRAGKATGQYKNWYNTEYLEPD